MTSPNQPLPDLSSFLGMGAFQVADGGGTTNYGQDGIDSSFVRSLVSGPATSLADVFDDIPAFLTGLSEYLLQMPLDALQLFQGFIPGKTIATDFPDVPTSVTTIMDALSVGSTLLPSGTFQDMLGKIFTAIQGSVPDLLGGDLLDALQAALQAIPFGNILGVGGPSTIGGSVTETWDQWISGLVGTIGSGAGLADLFNIGQEVSSRATKGQLSWDILGIRGNRGLNTGFLPSTISNISLDKIALQATAPTVAVTKTTALMSYHRIDKSMDLGVVSWQGYGTTNVTNFYVQLYKMNTTTGDNDTLLHTSADIVGSLTGGSTPVQVVYSLPTAVAVEPGDVIGVEFNVRGTGTHNVAGTTTWLGDQAVYPRRFSSVRDSSTTLSPSSFTPTYSSNVPFVEIGVSAGDVPIPHSPTTTQYSVHGTPSLVIPDWANYVDVICLGAGGGGHQGGTWGVYGEGGYAGSWASGTWVRGTDFSGTPTISITVGTAGTGGTSGNGGNGGSSSASITGHSVTGTGGAGSTNYGGTPWGDSPGNHTYNGVTYVGGAEAKTYGSTGNPSGGGGAGGNYVSFQPGGAGADGSVWIVFRQS